jgi:heavy metal sensor kinase
MEAGRLRLSIGARWALRYTVAMSVTLAVFAVGVYAAVSRRINREAVLVTEIHARELVDSLRTQSEEHAREEVLAWMESRIARSVEEEAPDLALGIEYLDAQGRTICVAGSLAGAGVPIPLDVLNGKRASSTRAVNLDGEYAHLVTVMAAPGGYVQVAIGTRRYAANLAFVREVLFGSLPVMLAATGFIGWYLARRSLDPLGAMSRTARRISSASLDERLPTRGSGDELDQLAATLNEMMERIREGVERMRRFNANAAHELRTPLNRLCGEIEATLQRERSAEEYRSVLEHALDQAHELSGGVNALLRLAQLEEGLPPESLGPVDLAALLATLVEFFAPLAEERGIEVTAEALPEALVTADGGWLRQLFSNLVDNAVKYCAPGCHVRISATRESDAVCVSVADDGPGIPRAELATLFERYGRGAAQRNLPGYGLGLPIAREIARAHGGRITVESEVGRGTTFRVWLPLRSPAFSLASPGRHRLGRA